MHCVHDGRGACRRRGTCAEERGVRMRREVRKMGSIMSREVSMAVRCGLCCAIRRLLMIKLV